MKISEVLAIVMMASTTLILLTMTVSNYLDGQPKNNKLRKWWSKHIVDFNDNENTSGF